MNVEEQQNETKAESNGSPLYKFKSVEALGVAYQNLEKEFTQKCQKIKELTDKLNALDNINQNFVPEYEKDDWPQKVLEFFNSHKDAKQYILNTDYTYYNTLKLLPLSVKNISNYKIKHFKNIESKNKYKVFLTGYSYNENLLVFLPYSFSDLKYYRLNSVIDVKEEETSKFLKRYKNDLLEYKPDILILTIDDYQLLSDNLWETY